jgi:hypothetical protein
MMELVSTNLVLTKPQTTLSAGSLQNSEFRFGTLFALSISQCLFNDAKSRETWHNLCCFG